MSDTRQDTTILIVDDESGSSIIRAVRRTLENEGWRTLVVEPDSAHFTADDFEANAL